MTSISAAVVIAAYQRLVYGTINTAGCPACNGEGEIPDNKRGRLILSVEFIQTGFIRNILGPYVDYKKCKLCEGNYNE